MKTLLASVFFVLFFNRVSTKKFYIWHGACAAIGTCPPGQMRAGRPGHGGLGKEDAADGT